MSDTESILPEILIDDTADEYVETDDEPGTPSPKTRPPANEIFYQDEEPPEDEPAPPAVEPTFNYVGCYFLFGHLLPPSEAEVRRLIERQPILWQW